MRRRKSRSQNEALSVLTTLMTYAFIDIRATSYVGEHAVEIEGVSDNEHIRLIADLFHNIPGRMKRATETDGDYQAVLDDLWSWANGAQRQWLVRIATSREWDHTSATFKSWK